MPELSELLPELERALGPAAGEPVPVSGGITNRNYRVRLGGRDCVIRLPGRDTQLLGIDRRAECLAAERAAALGIGPALLYADGNCAVTAFVPGSPVQPEQLRADPAQLAGALRAFHDSGLELPAGFWVPDLMRAYAAVVGERGGSLPPVYGRALDLVDRIAQALPLVEPVPCHDDLLAGNLIAAGGSLLLVDWEYAGLGHRYFDLGNLAVNNGFDDLAERRLLTAYLRLAPDAEDDLTPQLATLRLFRLVSDAREAAWGVVQDQISEIDFDFGAYADAHFERLGRAVHDPRQLEELLHAATT